MVSEGQTRAETDTPIEPQFLLFSINGSDGDMETFDNQMPTTTKSTFSRKIWVFGRHSC